MGAAAFTLHERWFQAGKSAEDGHAGMCAATAGSSAATGRAADDEFGDLKPGMTLTEEEEDEAEHYRQA